MRCLCPVASADRCGLTQPHVSVVLVRSGVRPVLLVAISSTLGTWCGDSPRNTWLRRVPTVEGATFGTGPASRVLPRAGDRMGVCVFARCTSFFMADFA